MAGTTVKYTGPTTRRRVISKKDFKSKDIDVPKDVVLSRENEFEMSLEGFSDEAVDLLEKQVNLKVTREEKEKPEQQGNQRGAGSR